MDTSASKECTENQPITGSPDDYTAPNVDETVEVDDPVICDDGRECRVVSLHRDGAHPVRFGRGCLRCESGRFVELDGREVRSPDRDEIFQRACTENTHTATDGCAIFSDIFLEGIAGALKRTEDIEVIGHGLSCLDRPRPMLAVHDHGEHGVAVGAVAEAMHTWEVDGVIDVAVCEIPGVCLEQ